MEHILQFCEKINPPMEPSNTGGVSKLEAIQRSIKLYLRRNEIQSKIARLKRRLEFCVTCFGVRNTSLLPGTILTHEYPQALAAARNEMTSAEIHQAVIVSQIENKAHIERFVNMQTSFLNRTPDGRQTLSNYFSDDVSFAKSTDCQCSCQC